MLDMATLLDDMPIAQLMSRRIFSVTPDTPVVEALSLFRAESLSCLLVRQPERLVGILTERDLVSLMDTMVAAGRLNVAHLGLVKEVMTAQPMTLFENDGLKVALDLCLARSIRHLPVINRSGQLVGVITQTDLVRAYSHIVERQLILASDNERLQALSLIDPLMNIGNRRAMERDLQQSQAMASRSQLPYGVVLLDIDWFKRFNDHYGHQQGDDALRQVAKAITGTLRQGDRLYRYGGEELILLLPETDDKGAQQAGERARQSVVELALPHIKSPESILTLSGGSASGCGDEDWQALVAEADSALYRAKQNGRNQVVAAAD